LPGGVEGRPAVRQFSVLSSQFSVLSDSILILAYAVTL
jgi:hypothetical protein